MSVATYLMTRFVEISSESLMKMFRKALVPIWAIFLSNSASRGRFWGFYHEGVGMYGNKVAPM